MVPKKTEISKQTLQTQIAVLNHNPVYYQLSYGVHPLAQVLPRQCQIDPSVLGRGEATDQQTGEG